MSAARPIPAGAARRLCLSRRSGEICTREAGHPGLHSRRDTGLMWSERGADPPRCPGSGAPGSPAEPLPDGFPGGRALCPVCDGFVPLRDGTLIEHDSWRGDATREEADRRREWFNTHGW
ncbi:hypothetical protein ACTU3I_07760 [Microbacterium sp. RD1]|uniref:hypothetical protein n=1 Tax=Microbacterium sp. RD1 TaxID=3457313 RepID=UPI003FA55706